MTENCFFIKKEKYDNGFFAAKPSALADTAILLHSLKNGKVIWVTEKTPHLDIVFGRYDEKIEISMKSKELKIKRTSESKIPKFFFDVTLKVSVNVKNPIYCLNTSDDEILESIYSKMNETIRNITRTYSPRNYNYMDSELLNALNNVAGTSEIQGFKYKLLEITCSISGTTANYVNLISRLENRVFKLTYSLRSKNSEYYFSFTASGRIKISDECQNITEDVNEITENISQFIIPIIKPIASKFSVFDYDNMIGQLETSLAGGIPVNNTFVFSAFEVNCEPDNNAKNFINYIKDIQNKAFVIPIRLESLDNTYYFATNATVRITIPDPFIFTIKNETGIVDLILPYLSSNIAEKARATSIITYENLTNNLTKMYQNRKLNMNEQHGFSFEIINIKCEPDENSKEYAVRIAKASLIEITKTKELDSRTNFDKKLAEKAKDPLTDILIALEKDVMDGKITNEQAIVKSKDYIQKEFERNYNNFNSIIDMINKMKTENLITNTNAQEYIKYAYNMNNILKGLPGSPPPAEESPVTTYEAEEAAATLEADFEDKNRGNQQND